MNKTQATSLTSVDHNGETLYVVNQHGHFFKLENLIVDRQAFHGCQLLDTQAAMIDHLVDQFDYSREELDEAVDGSLFVLRYNPRSDSVILVDGRGIGVPLDTTIESCVSDFEM